jgi:hypothetical protein
MMDKSANDDIVFMPEDDTATNSAMVLVVRS